MSCFTIAAAPELARIFPEARFVHSVRDGRDSGVSKVALREKAHHPTDAASGIDFWADRLRQAEEGVRGLEPRDRERLHLVGLDELVWGDRERAYADLLDFLGVDGRAGDAGVLRRRDDRRRRPPRALARGARTRPSSARSRRATRRRSTGWSGRATTAPPVLRRSYERAARLAAERLTLAERARGRSSSAAPPSAGRSWWPAPGRPSAAGGAADRGALSQRRSRHAGPAGRPRSGWTTSCARLRGHWWTGSGDGEPGLDEVVARRPASRRRSSAFAAPITATRLPPAASSSVSLLAPVGRRRAGAGGGERREHARRRRRSSRIFPEARFVHVVRDGRDAAWASAEPGGAGGAAGHRTLGRRASRDRAGDTRRGGWGVRTRSRRSASAWSSSTSWPPASARRPTGRCSRSWRSRTIPRTRLFLEHRLDPRRSGAGAGASAPAGRPRGRSRAATAGRWRARAGGKPRRAPVDRGL